RRPLAAPGAWRAAPAAPTRRAHHAGVPVLGVCFGHQLLGHAFGARVRKNPTGWEVGTLRMDLTDDGAIDPLFHGLPASPAANFTHEDDIDPGTLVGARILATNAATPVVALAYGDATRGVQFHPEITGNILAGYVRARRAVLPSPDAIRAADAPDGEAVLRNFRRQFVDRA